MIPAAIPTGQGPATDPYWANVKLLLHCDGTNDSQTFTDSSTTANTMLNGASTKIKTAIKKFGTGSANFTGIVTDYVNPSGSACALGTGSYTFEAWVYVTSFPAGMTLLDFRFTGGGDAYPSLYISASKLGAFFNDAVQIADSVDFPTSTWTHIALCRNSTTTRLFKAGVQVGSNVTDSRSYATASNTPYLGNYKSLASPLTGYLDDVRVTPGIARYTANFTPPTAAFPNG